MAHRDLYAALLVRTPTGPADATLDLPAGIDVTDVAAALDAVFVAPGEPAEVDLVIGGEPIGRASRDQLVVTARQYGDADGATLPGHSFKYQLFTLVCPRCGARVFRIHLDGRDRPSCPAGHGPLVVSDGGR